MFHQDNVKRHTSVVIGQKRRELGWTVFIVLPYIPEAEISEYYMFLPMAIDFAGEKFVSKEACENRLSQFFANGDEGFEKTLL